MFRTQTDVYGVLELFAALRRAVLDGAGMDPAQEPVPLVGRSPRDDVLGSVAYLGALVERAASVARCSTEELAERALERLAEIAPHALASVDAEDTTQLAVIIPLHAPPS
jgi:hypothetical protein